LQDGRFLSFYFLESYVANNKWKQCRNLLNRAKNLIFLCTLKATKDWPIISGFWNED
jgi:hypothetical protein